MSVGATLHALGVSTLLGLTATATERTAASIRSTLSLPADAVCRPAAVLRANLHLAAEIVDPNQRLGRVRTLLSNDLPPGGAAIVYCNSRWEVDETARDLRSRGWKCDGYHAGRPSLERQQVQGAFMSGALQVVVATVAFGMGVHKADVRLVVHAGLPRSIEAWVQETGRAGRDGLPARCVSLLCEEDYRRLHSQCFRDGVEHEQLHQMVTHLFRNARNGYGELAQQQLETKLDMSREVAQTALALLAELPASAWEAPPEQDGNGDGDGRGGDGGGEAGGDDEMSGGEEATAYAPAAPRAAAAAPSGERSAPLRRGPGGSSGLFTLLPEIRRTAVMRFHVDPAEVVGARSPLVAMLLKYAKQTNGVYKAPLVQAASELGVDAHAAYEQLAALHVGGVFHLELHDPAFYFALQATPTAAELRALTAELLRRMQHVEQLQRTKLDASATLLWALATGGGVGVGDCVGTAGGGDAANEAPSTDALLARYFADGELEEEGWSAPFRRRTLPPSLRGDVLDFVATHATDVGKAGVQLTGRAVARILHRLPSPSFPKHDWEKNKFWGMHRDVDFDVLRRLADEHLETWRRKLRQHSLVVNRNKAKHKRARERDS